jgi:uncharacterized membrane protein
MSPILILMGFYCVVDVLSCRYAFFFIASGFTHICQHSFITNFAIMMGIFMILSTCFIIVSLIIDIIYSFIFSNWKRANQRANDEYSTLEKQKKLHLKNRQKGGRNEK